MKAFTYIGAFLLCGMSLICSVALWYSEQPTLIGAIIFGVFAAGLEVCKFIFFPFAAMSSGWSKLGLYTFGGILVAFSIFATAAFLETGANVTNVKAKNTSFEYQAVIQDIQNLEIEIQINMAAKDKAVKNNYRKEARGYDTHINQLKKDKETKLNILSDMKVISQNGTQSLINSLSALLGLSLVTTRQLLYLIIALLVDLGGIRCLMLLTNPSNAIVTASNGPVTHPVTASNATDQIVHRVDKLSNAPVTTDNAPLMPDNVPVTNHVTEEKSATRKRYQKPLPERFPKSGDKITYPILREKMGIGNAKAAQLRNQWIESGQLKKVGKDYIYVDVDNIISLNKTENI